MTPVDVKYSREPSLNRREEKKARTLKEEPRVKNIRMDISDQVLIHTLHVQIFQFHTHLMGMHLLGGKMECYLL